MTIGIFDRYGSRANAGSASYPDGSFKDETAPGMKNGTPVQQDWANDKEAFFQKLRQVAGIEVNGDVDTVTLNQNWNALLSLLSDTAPHQATPADICSGMPDVNCADPSASPNYWDTSQTIRDACLGWDADLGKPCIFIVYGTVTISKIMWPWYYSGSISPTVLSPTWTTTPDEVLAVCCDAEYLYVAWRETGANVKLSKFAINPWTGTEVFTSPRDTGYQSRPTSGDPACRLCVADDDSIGVLLNQNTAPDEHRVRLGVWKKNNASYIDAQFSSYKSDYTSCSIVSDGTYLYAPAIDDSASPTWTNRILRADISDPTTQSSSAMPFSFNSTTQYENGIGAIYPVRGMIIIALMDGSLYAYKNGSISSYPICSDLPMTFYDASGRYGALMCSDGLNLHIQLVEEDELSVSGFHSVFKIPIGEFLWEAIETTPIDYQHKRVRVGGISSIPTTAPMGKLLFDRRDMWLILRTGEIYRLYNPAGS